MLRIVNFGSPIFDAVISEAVCHTRFSILWMPFDLDGHDERISHDRAQMSDSDHRFGLSISRRVDEESAQFLFIARMIGEGQ